MLRGFFKFLFGRPTPPKPPASPPVVPLPNQPNHSGANPPWRPEHSNEDMTLIDPVAKDIWAADKATKKEAPKPASPPPPAPPAGPKG